MAKNRYDRLIEEVFKLGYLEGATEVQFAREDFEKAASSLGLRLPKNLGDIVYSFRSRNELPEAITSTQGDMEWVIEGKGKGQYAFRLVPFSKFRPTKGLQQIRIPDSTPEVFNMYSLSDEQALLAKIRYNRIIDIFLGLTTYSLQNHLRTTVKGVGQIEVDELYMGIDRNGAHYIIPVQAKGGSDVLTVVQTKQDIQYCRQNFEALTCKAISAQFISEKLIAIFELSMDRSDVFIVNEKHYLLTPGSEIDQSTLQLYGTSGLRERGAY